MKKKIVFVLISLMWCNILFSKEIESNNDIYIKCVPNEYRLNKVYFDKVMISLEYIKFSSKNNVYFGWNSKREKFERKSSFKMYENHYHINKNLKSGITTDRIILSLSKSIKISRDDGLLWMGRKNTKNDNEDMQCVKIHEIELPKEKLKKIF